jgi:hypothetical protein
MRIKTGGVAHIAKQIEEDLRGRETGLYVSHISGLSDIAASVLSCRNVNTTELANVLPRQVNDADARYRYINRLLQNKRIAPLTVIKSYVQQVLQQLNGGGQTVVLMMDQSKIGTKRECLMVSLRFGNRALPAGWIVRETEGNIGFHEQEALLTAVASMVPAGVPILLAADRFYGTSMLVAWCQKQGWSYRIRLKGNLIFQHQGGDITPLAALKNNVSALENATFNDTNVTTNIGILHENGHPEPWFIAMDCPPTKYKVLDYGMRWGIESMFSDFKSRGFGIANSQLKHTDRLERLILILTIAMYWAVSTGLNTAQQPSNAKKNT